MDGVDPTRYCVCVSTNDCAFIDVSSSAPTRIRRKITSVSGNQATQLLMLFMLFYGTRGLLNETQRISVENLIRLHAYEVFFPSLVNVSARVLITYGYPTSVRYV